MTRILLALAFITATDLVHSQFCSVNITYEVSGLQVQYFATSPDNPAQWSWFFNGGTPMTSSEQNPVVTYDAPGEYICAVSISGGPNECSAALSSGQATVNVLPTSVDEDAMDPFFFRSISAERIEVMNDASERITMNVLDLSGKMVGAVFEGIMPTGVNTFSMPKMDEGLYLLSVIKPGGEFTRRFVVE